jgi:hypothetical protein
VVADRELPLDESLHAGQRPPLAVEPGGGSPGVEQAKKLSLLLPRELARAARSSGPAQSPLTAFVESASPLMDGGGGDAEASGDLAQREPALSQEPCRFSDCQ